MRSVYFIRARELVQSPVKIGVSRSPERRRDTLETWSPFPLEVVAEIEGDLQLERRFHAKFHEHHTHREWFAWSPDIDEVIEQIRAGTFDIATLPPPERLKKGRSTLSPRKWTDEERARCRRRNAMRRAEKISGLVCDYPHTDERVDAFIANPSKHGVEWIVRQQGGAKRVAEYQLERAAATLRDVGLDPAILKPHLQDAAA